MKVKRVLIALAAIIVLAGGLKFWRFAEWSREDAFKTVCVHHLHVLALPLQHYAKEHDGAFPSAWSELFPKYIQPDFLEPFVCHRQAREYKKATGKPYTISSAAEVDEKSSYVLVPGRRLMDDPDTILAYERDGHHGDRGHAVVHVDGRGGWEPRMQWRNGCGTSTSPARP